MRKEICESDSSFLANTNLPSCGRMDSIWSALEASVSTGEFEDTSFAQSTIYDHVLESSKSDPDASAFYNNGRDKIDNPSQMQLIIDGVKEKQAELEKKNELDRFPFGLKIVYCTPRSIPKKMMQEEMKQCIELKIQYPNLICGKLTSFSLAFSILSPADPATSRRCLL